METLIFRQPPLHLPSIQIIQFNYQVNSAKFVLRPLDKIVQIVIRIWLGRSGNLFQHLRDQL